jgi:hypothetical protein
MEIMEQWLDVQTLIWLFPIMFVIALSRSWKA